jgi:alpha-beta hydrolase superfamily lysophospholipase
MNSLATMARLLLSLLLFLLQATAIVFVTLILAGAFAARQRADLETWHTVWLESEFKADDGTSSFEEYLDLEQRLFRELEDKVTAGVELGDSNDLNRYARGSQSYPDQDGINFNRTQILEPDQIRGGVLLLHGMTDSPYSLRHYADLFRAQGFYALNQRMPAHGTVPAALVGISWEDWSAAVRLGAEQVISRLGPDMPFFIMGYSNGGSLAIRYTLDSLEDSSLRTPDQLILVSPMLGVSGMARFSKIYSWLGKIDYFEKALWLDLLPEYDPHKYNSFPMNAARQSLRLTGAVNQQLMRMAARGALKDMPPVLTVQSLVDATVITRDIVTRLYLLFDVNRAGVLEYFVRPRHDALLEELKHSAQLDYRLTILANESGRSQRIDEYSKPPQELNFANRDLALSWPGQFYSLSHIALPFPSDDMVYGTRPKTGHGNFPHIGIAQMVGDTDALVFPVSLYTRARSNPFHDYVTARVQGLIEQHF